VSAKRNDTAGVIAPPPLIYALALGAALLLHRLVALHLLSYRRIALWLVGGVLIRHRAERQHRCHNHVPKSSHRYLADPPTSRLVLSGPYRYSRNPDYIGQLVLSLGITLVANTWWPILLLPPVLGLIECGVVRREEKYLETKFGQEYRNYKQCVHRWLWGTASAPDWREDTWRLVEAGSA